MTTEQPEQPAPKKSISKWTIAWIIWIVMFLVIEALALVNKTEGDTLSEKIRSWGGIKTPERKGAQWAVFLAFLVFIIWFPIHILTERV